MTSPPDTNGFHGGQEADPEAPRPPVAGANPTMLRHQVKEVHRMVDHAVENLEQVLRALRYIERDL